MKKYYSVGEAEEIIPLIKPKILNIMKLSKAIDFLDAIELEYENQHEAIKRDVALNKKFHEFSFKFCKEVEKLLDKGIVLKDVDMGLVNFYSMLGSQEIYLCWRLGEDKINHWYEIDSEYDFRKPISELKKQSKH